MTKTIPRTAVQPGTAKKIFIKKFPSSKRSPAIYLSKRVSCSPSQNAENSRHSYNSVYYAFLANFYKKIRKDRYIDKLFRLFIIFYYINLF